MSYWVQGAVRPLPCVRGSDERRIARSRCSSEGVVEVLVMLGGWTLQEISRWRDSARLTFEKDGQIAVWKMPLDTYHEADVSLGGLYWIGGWKKVSP